VMACISGNVLEINEDLLKDPKPLLEGSDAAYIAIIRVRFRPILSVSSLITLSLSLLISIFHLNVISISDSPRMINSR